MYERRIQDVKSASFVDKRSKPSRLVIRKVAVYLKLITKTTAFGNLYPGFGVALGITKPWLSNGLGIKVGIRVRHGLNTPITPPTKGRRVPAIKQVKESPSAGHRY